jgi:hypothetical protein
VNHVSANSEDSTLRPNPHETYLLEPRICRHREASARLILRAAEMVPPGHVVVLGAGLCEEIPLGGLTARFSQLVINDVAADTLERGISAAGLGQAARDKLDLRIADLTGITHALVMGIRQILSESPEPEVAVDRMCAILDAAPKGAFPIAGRFDLAIASCVLSQLHCALVHDSSAAFIQQFPDLGNLLNESSRWKASVYAIARRMEHEFIDNLARLVTDEGLIYLSESVQMCFVTTTPAGKWQTEGSWRMLRTTRLADYLNGRFTVVESGRWDWVVGPLSSGDQRSRWYDVQAIVARVTR